MLCWATQLGPTWRTDAHDRSLLIGLIPLASCIEYSLAKEQPQEAHHCLVDATSGYGVPLLPLPSQTNDSWRIEEAFDEQPCRLQGQQGRQNQPRWGDDFGPESCPG